MVQIFIKTCHFQCGVYWHGEAVVSHSKGDFGNMPEERGEEYGA